MSCCNPRGCDGFFTARLARRAAKRYREKGIDKTAQRMIAFLEQHGLAGATVLEVGGGVGELQIECLKRGAARTLNLELSPAYDDEAALLLREAGVEERAWRRLHDLAADPDGVEPADVVVLHRVVCCYPDYELLLGAAAEHARRLLVFSYPPRQCGFALPDRCAEPLLQDATDGVPDVRASAGADVRRRREARPAERLHAPSARLADRRVRALTP